MAEVIIRVRPDGGATIEADNVQGSACSLHTAPFVAALGKRAGEKAKPEMFQEAAQQQQVKQ
jgi:hypothetical protein